MTNFDKDMRAGMAYALELAFNNLTGMWGMTSDQVKAEPDTAAQHMPYGVFITLGILSAISAFLLEEDDAKAVHLLTRTLECMDPVMLEAQGVPQHLSNPEKGELN